MTIPAGPALPWSRGSRFVRLAAVAAVALVSACSTTPKRGGEPVPRAASGGSSAPSTASSAPRKGGGYYLDDGPGDNPPPDLDLLPDAVPRIEKYASGANRPYNVFGVDYVPDLSGAAYRQRGVGSWYGRKFHGQRTSNGEIYDMYAMTAAHPTLPIPCYALVTNLQNGRSVIVRVNDRGPFLHNRVMDLSYAAAWKLGYMSSGSGLIEVEMLRPADIAAGRIPTTTTALLATASMANGSTSGGAPSSAAPVSPDLTIEALTASVAGTTAARASMPVSSASPGANGATNEVPRANGPTGASTANLSSGLPPAPTIAPQAISRSLPATSSSASLPPSETERPPDLLALPDRQPAAALPEVATNAGFYLQLGAFRARAGADSFASHVAREIDPAIASRVHVVDVSGLYRVRVGPYAQRVEADGVAVTLRAAISQPVLVMPDSGRAR